MHMQRLLCSSSQGSIHAVPLPQLRIPNQQWRLLAQHCVCPSACSCSTRPPRMVEGSGSDGPLQCQRLVLADSPSTEVVLDPSTYGYQGCSCKAPFSAESTVQGGATTSLRCVVPNQVRESRACALQESDCRLRAGQLQQQVVASAASAGSILAHAARRLPAHTQSVSGLWCC